MNKETKLVEYKSELTSNFVKSVLTRLQIANVTQTKITSMERLEKPLVEPVPLREAVINAVVHNDYSREVPPLFEIFSDKIVITTYGGLVQGLSLDDFYNCCSMPRNRELMRVFHDLEMVEQLGSCMQRILNEYKKDIFSFTTNFMKVTFNFDQTKLPSENTKLGSKLGSLSNMQTRIIELIEQDNRVSITQMSQKLGYSTTAIEKNLAILKDNNYIKRIGKTSAGYWEITQERIE